MTGRPGCGACPQTGGMAISARWPRPAPLLAGPSSSSTKCCSGGTLAGRTKSMALQPGDVQTSGGGQLGGECRIGRVAQLVAGRPQITPATRRIEPAGGIISVSDRSPAVLLRKMSLKLTAYSSRPGTGGGADSDSASGAETGISGGNRARGRRGRVRWRELIAQHQTGALRRQHDEIGRPRGVPRAARAASGPSNVIFRDLVGGHAGTADT